MADSAVRSAVVRLRREQDGHRRRCAGQGRAGECNVESRLVACAREADPVDPRDAEWEVDEPAYRVYFWRQPVAPAGVRQEHMGYEFEEYRLSGADDVHEVLAWAAEHAQLARSFTLYVEHRREERIGLIKLAGLDPTQSVAEA